MLDRAKFLLISEIAEVEGRPATAVEEKVERALAKTFSPESTKSVGKKPVQKPVGARRTSDA